MRAFGCLLAALFAFALIFAFMTPADAQFHHRRDGAVVVAPVDRGAGWRHRGWDRGRGGYNPYNPYSYVPPAAGRWFKGAWYPQQAGSPCWTWLPVIGWSWSCGE